MAQDVEQQVLDLRSNPVSSHIYPTKVVPTRPLSVNGSCSKCLNYMDGMGFRAEVVAPKVSVTSFSSNRTDQSFFFGTKFSETFLVTEKSDFLFLISVREKKNQQICDRRKDADDPGLQKNFFQLSC